MTYCCGTSVAAVIRDEVGRVLLLHRAWWPYGWAWPAGHGADEDQASMEAARDAEVAEEVGLTVVSADLVVDGRHLPNLCSAPPATSPGHRWWIWTVEASGALAPSATETRGAGWYTPTEVAELAEVTIRQAWDLGPDGYAAAAAAGTLEPGLEAVMVEHAAYLGHIHATRSERDAVARIYTMAPPTYWTADLPTAGTRP